MKPWYAWRPQQLLIRALRGEADIIRLPTGQLIEINPREGVGRSLLRRATHDLPVSEMVLRLLRPGDSAIDVGANIGVITQLMALAVAPKGKVFSYEPHPKIFEHLLRNIAHVRLLAPRVRIVAERYALSAVTRQGHLELPQGFESNEGLARLSNGNGIVVQCRALDELIDAGDKYRLMKIDVEGHELEVLRGAERLLLSKAIRHVIFEEHNDESPVIDLLYRHGFKIRRLGWQLRGPRLTLVADRSILRPPEPPNFIATLDITEVETAARATGWRALRRA